MPYSYMDIANIWSRLNQTCVISIFIPGISLKVVQHLQQRLNLLRYIANTVAHPVQQHLTSATKKYAKAKF